MEILKIKSHELRNEEHYNFHNEVNDLVLRFTVEALKIQRIYPAYEAAFATEGEALDVVQKSIFTGPIADADHNRDTILRGLADTIDGAIRHFDESVREAARRIKIVLDSFGNIASKGYNQETAAIKALVNDLETGYAADVATAGVAGWITALKSANEAFEALVDERYTDEAAKTPLNMKTARKQLDEAYRELTRLVDALMVVEGPETWEDFVKEMNKRIEKYNNLLDQRGGRNKKDNEEE